jgi:hypothetical protein
MERVFIAELCSTAAPRELEFAIVFFDIKKANSFRGSLLKKGDVRFLDVV